MADEATPLLPDATEHDLIYQRFSIQQKRLVVAIVSWCGLMPPFISGTFLPSIPQIAADLETTGEVISYAVSLSIFAAAIGSLGAAAYSAYYGRRAIFLTTLPISIAGSIGVATARSIPSLMFWRFWQAAGAAPGLSVGAGVIGDIFIVEERGTALGIFFGATLLGPALAPFVGGFTTQYASWRILQLGLGIFGVVGLIFMFFAFPETSHPGSLGVDKQIPSSSRRWLPVFINPLKPLGLLRGPNLVLITMIGLVTLLTDYVLLVPLAYTIGSRYNIRNGAILGACYLPSGIGNIVGAPISGRIADRVTVKWKSKRGFWHPEDRLRASLVGSLVLVPCSILGSGLLTKYVGGRTGLALNLLCLFINGFGVDMVLGPTAAYVVDIVNTRSAEGMAATTGLRALILSCGVAGILPLINTYGVATTDLLSALLAWIGFGLTILLIRYGDHMRKYMDIGYSV